MMLETWRPIVVTAGAVIAALIVMIGFWRFVVRSLSESSNWPELARRFPSKGRPEGRVFGRQTGTLQGVAHQGILRVTPSASGFFVELERPFAYRESPLLIPWSAFRERRRLQYPTAASTNARQRVRSQSHPGRVTAHPSVGRSVRGMVNQPSIP